MNEKLIEAFRKYQNGEISFSRLEELISKACTKQELVEFISSAYLRDWITPENLGIESSETDEPIPD